MTWLNFVWLLAAGVGMTLASRRLLHYFQLESYQFPGYFRSVKRNFAKSMEPGTLMSAALLVVYLLLTLLDLPEWCLLPLGAVVIACGWLVRCRTYDKQAKKKFAITPRVKRLYAVSAVVHTLVLMAGYALLVRLMHTDVPLMFVPLLLPLTTALCGLVAWPIELGINEMYFRDAQRILNERPDLIKIGITGSYGKTSVKFILGTLLAEKFQTLVTPSSFNTPMGVTKIIRTKLQPAHQVFVAEMGARHVGDIKELCRLVHPKYGVLTSVGPQHLDTFKTIERIKGTKYELMDAIPQDGCCFFQDDQGICAELYDKTTKEKRRCSIYSHQADVWAESITVSPAGSTFMLCTKDERMEVTARLLGEHNIQNILLAATVCLRLGMTLKQIARGIAKLQPVEHRLQLLSNPGGMTIIDDAFNSNPRSSAAALTVLSQFPGRRIIITPGMVELGAEEAKYNHDFGVKMASCADVAILVGIKRSQPIADGLKEAGFPAGSIHQVASLNDAAALLRQLGKAGDTVLFENDLPDNYAE